MELWSLVCYGSPLILKLPPLSLRPVSFEVISQGHQMFQNQVNLSRLWYESLWRWCNVVAVLQLTSVCMLILLIMVSPTLHIDVPLLACLLCSCCFYIFVDTILMRYFWFLWLFLSLPTRLSFLCLLFWVSAGLPKTLWWILIKTFNWQKTSFGTGNSCFILGLIWILNWICVCQCDFR